MGLIDRYILRTHIGPFVFGFAVVVFLFLMQFVIKYIDDLVGKGLSYWIILQLIGLNLAWMVVLAVPIGVLFSTLMAFGSMSSAHEVTIIKSSGGSLLRMMLSVVIIGFMLTYGLFEFNNIILPEANHRAKVLMSDIKRKKPTFELESGRFSSDLEGYTILSRKVDSLTGLLKGVTIYDHRKANYLNIVSADTGIAKFTPDFTKLILTLYNGEIHQMQPFNLNNYREVNFSRHQIAMDARGFSFERTAENVISRGDRELSIEDMEEIRNEALFKANKASDRINDEIKKHYDHLTGILESSDKEITVADNKFEEKEESDYPTVRQLNEAQKRLTFLKSTIQSDIFQESEYQQKARQYQVEIQKKYAIPFACLVFIFVGCPLGIMTRGGNFGISAAITLGFYIFYWACLIGGEKLADRGFMSPTLSMWIGNILIGIMGLILTIRVSNESFNLPGSNLIGKLLKRKQ